MAIILGLVFLSVLPAVLPQGLSPRGPRPIPGQGDRFPPTPAPDVLKPNPQGCKSEFCFGFFTPNEYFLQTLFYLEYTKKKLPVGNNHGEHFKAQT